MKQNHTRIDTLALVLIALVGFGGLWTRPAQAQGSPDIIWGVSGHAGTVRASVVSPDGSTLVTGADDRLIRAWNFSTGTLIRTFSGHNGVILSLAVTPDGRTLYSTSNDSTVRRWRISDGALLQTISDPAGGLAISPDGDLFATSGNYSGVKIWSTATGTVLRQTVYGGGPVAFHPDGTMLACGGGAERGFGVTLFRVSDGGLIQVLNNECYANSIAFNPDGTKLATCDGNGAFCGNSVQLWRVADGARLRVLGNLGNVSSITFSPDGSTIASGGVPWYGSPPEIRIWCGESGNLLRMCNGETDNGVTRVAFSFRPEGLRLAYTRVDGGVLVADPNVGPCLHCPPAQTVIAEDPAGASVSLTAHFDEAEGDPVTVAWYLNGSLVQTDVSPAAPHGVSQDVTLTRIVQPGTYSVRVIAADGDGAPAACDTTLTVLICTPVPGDATAWWRGEGAANDSIGAYHGTLRNGAAVVPGLVGGALSFDGVNDYVSVPNGFSDLMSGRSAFTVEGWVRGGGGTVWSSASSDEYGTPILYGSIGDSVFFGGDFGELWWDGFGTPGGIITSAWHHIAFVKNSASSGRIYVDGVERAAGILPEIAATSGESLNIGGPADVYIGDWGHYLGELDEWTVYGRALTASEIQAIFMSSAAGKCAWAPATASAGGDFSVNEGQLVELDGSGSGPDPGALTYEWLQLPGGTAVMLSAANTAHPTFTAPLVALGGETLTFQLTVSANGRSSTDTVSITVVNVNHPPVADAGLDQSVVEGAPVMLHGGDSFDIDNDLFSYLWVQIGGPTIEITGADTSNPTFTAPYGGGSGAPGVVATLVFALRVGDGYPLDEPAPGYTFENIVDQVTVEVTNVNNAPTATADDDQTVEEHTPVALNGARSSDPDSDALSYAWVQVGGAAVVLTGGATATPSFTAPFVSAGGADLGFELTVDDGYGGVSTDTVVVHVQNINDPPLASAARPTLALLWPPNHSLMSVGIVGVSDPDNNAIITITGVTQDEPTSGQGPGDTAVDAIISGDGTVLLRAERAGNGNGRVYHIHFSASDQEGTVLGVVTVSVPHQGKTAAIDDGELYDSTQ